MKTLKSSLNVISSQALVALSPNSGKVTAAKQIFRVFSRLGVREAESVYEYFASEFERRRKAGPLPYAHCTH